MGPRVHIRFCRRVAIVQIDTRFRVYCSVEFDSVKGNVFFVNGVINIAVRYITGFHVAAVWLWVHIGRSAAAVRTAETVASSKFGI